MHPEIARELTAQHGRELRKQACRAMLARTVSRRQRAARRGVVLLDEGDGFICPAIPDYVDGSFQTVSPTGDGPASQAGHVPAARRAA
jgi:hypothetical protein